MSGIIKLQSENFTAVPNQKAFRVHKKREQRGVKDPRVSDLYRDDVLDASADLKDTTFKVYMYFAVNQDGYIGGLSKIDVLKRTKISESSYRRAIKELEEKGYFAYANIFVEDVNHMKLPLYDFYARPLCSI